MIKIKTLFLLGFFVITLAIYKTIVDYAEKTKVSRVQLDLATQEIEKIAERIGEKIVYDVKLGKVQLGRAKFLSLPSIEAQGRRLNLITFETNLARFVDREKIYYDPISFLPIKVEREIKNWFATENITEDYDQKKFVLTINKEKGQNKEQIVIKQGGHIHNAILLPYYVRRMPRLDVGWILLACLPTRRFLIKLVSVEDIRVPAGCFRAYHFQSEPKEFQIWISTDQRRIPLKIEGMGVFGYTLVMKEYLP